MVELNGGVSFSDFILLGFAALGVATFAWSLWNILRALESRRWPTVEGVVLVSDLQRTRDSDGAQMYRAEVSYKYTVGDRAFVSSRTRFGDRVSLSWSKPALDIVQRYPVGASVKVRYAPDDPSDSVLESRISGGLLFTLAIDVVVLTAGILAWLKSLLREP